MRRTLAYTSVHLKSFIRNWKSVVLLVVIPLVLILLVFASFNPLGLQRLPVGIIMQKDVQALETFITGTQSFLDAIRYEKLDTCLERLRERQTYACVVLSAQGSIVVDVFIDNTREPVIWELVQRIKSTIDYLQQEHARGVANNVLQGYGKTKGKVEKFSDKLDQTGNDIDAYAKRIAVAIKDLGNNRDELQDTLQQMDEDITDLRQTRNELQQDKQNLYTRSRTAITSTKTALNSLIVAVPESSSYVQNAAQPVQELEYDIESYNQKANAQFTTADNKLRTYEIASNRGRQTVGKMNIYIDQLQQTRLDLLQYQRTIRTATGEVDTLLSEFSSLNEMNPETLANPYIFKTTPAYIPNITIDLSATASEDIGKKAAQGANFISLQTMFPTILFLIIIFMSLLISSYLTLQTITAEAQARVRLYRHVFLAEMISLIIASSIILIIPSILLLLVGKFVFLIPIDHHIFPVSLLIALCAIFFIFVGMSLAYMIRQESPTLLVSTFMLIAILFFSGFLFPLERMSQTAGTLASLMPSRVALLLFSKIVFHQVTIAAIQVEMIYMAFTTAIGFAMTTIIKIIRG